MINDRYELLNQDVNLIENFPSCQMVITDPPYSSGGAMRSDRMKMPGFKYSSAADENKQPDFFGDNRDQRSFLAWTLLWMTKLFDAVDDGSSMMVFSDWRQLPVMSDAGQMAGWVWRNVGVWSKPKHLSRPQKGTFWSSQEYMLHFVKGATPKEVDHCLDGVIEANTPNFKDRRHLTEKPISLLAELVKICPSGGVVLDPFCGSGTTGVAALQAGLKFIGIEKSPHYFNVASERLSNVGRGASMDADPFQGVLI